MTETITNSRLSIVSGEAFFEHLGDLPRALPDRPWLAGDYGLIYGKLRGTGTHPRYAFPWRDGQRSAFWKAYCEQTPANQVSAGTAMRLLVPLRMVAAPPPRVSVTGGSERVFFDAYAFPYGLVVALTIQLNGTDASGTAYTLDAWRDRVRALRMAPGFTLEVPGAPPESDMRAQDVLSALLRWYREQYFGPITVVTASETPFSLVSVIQGTGVDPEMPLSASPVLQKTLNAVSSWPVNWQGAALPDLADVVLPASSINASLGDALYATRRGRVLWRPGLFTYPSSPGERLHALSCLGHNLLAGTVQAESLRLFAVRLAALSQAELSVIPPMLRQRAATLIGRLSRGEQTYRSASIKRLLADAGSLAQVNQLLSAEGIDPIA